MCTARLKRAMLLGRRKTWTTTTLLGERRQDYKGKESWTPRWERAVLRGRRDMDDDYAAGWKRAGLLGERELDFLCGLLGGRGLCCWAGETWMMIALLDGRGQDC